MEASMKVLAACVIAALPAVANADLHWWSFENRPYYDPLIAGVRDPNFSALVPARFDRMKLMVRSDQPRLGWDIDVGTEMPIFGSETSDSPKIAPQAWGWGLWIPIDFHMIEDFIDPSAPVVNIDYRFSGMLKVRYGLAKGRWLAGRIQYGHESTHLGDEFSIRAQAEHRNTFERINVSWEYLDVGVLYEWNVAKQDWSIRGGATMTAPFHSSYYQTGPGSVTESFRPVTESTNWFDPYAGIEFKREKLLFNRTYDAYVSSELRWRSVYDYHKTDPDKGEERQASINLIAGFKKGGTGRGIGRASPFVRFYRGVNPHGQFRNQKNYREIGIGVRLVR
jgi:hypothetical protein